MSNSSVTALPSARPRCANPRCGAFLRRENNRPGGLCDPCWLNSIPPEELREPDDPMIAELDRYRTERRLEEMAEAGEGLAA